MLLVYLIQSGAAKKLPAIFCEDAEFISRLRFTTLSANSKPVEGIFVYIAALAPRHPSTNSLNRLQNGPCKSRRVAAFEWSKYQSPKSNCWHLLSVSTQR